MKIKKKVNDTPENNNCSGVCEGCSNLMDTIPYCQLVRKHNPISMKKDDKIVTLKDHKKELEKFIFRPIQITQKAYKELEQMASKQKQHPQQFLENLITEVHKHFF